MNTTSTETNTTQNTTAKNGTAPTIDVSELDLNGDLGSDAEHQRGQMVRAFRAWVIKKRVEVEDSLYTNRRHRHNCAPFARIALDTFISGDTEEQQEAWPVVWEFTTTCLSILDDQTSLDLLNSYYFERDVCDVDLQIHLGNADRLRHLFDWYRSEELETKAD
jgi:hypothetical protein